MNRENAILKQANLRSTERRKKMLNILLNAPQPLSPEEIFLKLKEEDINVNLSTVYRAMQVFERKGLVIKNLRSNGIAYFQMNTDDHRHLIICKDCGKVVTIKNCPLEKFENKVISQTGYKITGHNLEFIGICPKCQNK